MSSDEPDTPEAWVKFEEALNADDKTAVREHLRFFAETGIPVNSALIAAMYEDGHDQIRASRALAFYWYGQSAYEENDKYGYFGLARCYFDGLHSPRDMEAGIELFKHASSMGLMQANVVLGNAYLCGWGVARDVAKAEFYLRPAASAGYVAAYALLAKIAQSRRQYLTSARYWIRSIRTAWELLRDPDDHRLYLLNDAVKKAMSTKTTGR